MARFGPPVPHPPGVFSRPHVSGSLASKDAMLTHFSHVMGTLRQSSHVASHTDSHAVPPPLGTPQFRVQGLAFRGFRQPSHVGSRTLTYSPSTPRHTAGHCLSYLVIGSCFSKRLASFTISQYFRLYPRWCCRSTCIHSNLLAPSQQESLRGLNRVNPILLLIVTQK